MERGAVRLFARLRCRLFGHLPLEDFSAFSSEGHRLFVCPRCLRVPRQ